MTLYDEAVMAGGTEGWGLFEATGSDWHTDWQVQRDDEAEVFESDEDAWRFIVTNAISGHQGALAVLTFLADPDNESVKEVEQIVYACFGLGTDHSGDPSLSD